MKKILIWIMAACVLLSAPDAALAGTESGVYRILPLQTYDSRVKLRRRPSTDAEILGQYFAGTEMTVLSWEGDWACVSVFGRKGYMIRRFLMPSDSADPLVDCPIGCALYEDASGQGVKVREQPDRSSAVVTTLNRLDGVTVLGTVGEDWLHIAVQLGGQAAVFGFVSSRQITQVDNFASAVVNSGKADETVNIRSSPGKQSQVLGKLFSGVQVSRLFDEHPVGDGWDRVRVGSVVGYIQEKYLDYSSAGCPQYRPPMTELKSQNAPLYDSAELKTAVGSLSAYDPFCVLGVFGGVYLVRAETWIGEYERGFLYGFLSQSDVKARVTASVSTAGVMLRDTAVYQRDADGGRLVQIGFYARGTESFIYGSADAYGNFVSEYVSPDAEYLLVDGGEIGGYVPVDAVQFDPGLMYPESMTLG